MVVTFVIGSLEYICEVLDRKRLNKQKVEANQILKASLGLTKGWINHPAVLMWKGYSNALKYYFNEITNACIRRGFQNNMTFYEFTEEQLNNVEYQTIQDYLLNGIPIEASIDKIIFPWWFQWKPLIYSHQASLLRKDPKYHNLIFYMFDDYEFNHIELQEYALIGYLWPHKLSMEQIENFLPIYCDEIGTGAPAIYRWTKEEVIDWLSYVHVNPKTGRTIKPSKTGIYADLKKAAKLYGFDISDIDNSKKNEDDEDVELQFFKKNKDIISSNVNDASNKLINSEKNNSIVNRGTGAGGSNTNYHGKKFEEKTNNQQRLLNIGYTKNRFATKSKKQHDYYLSKTFEDKTIIFILQNGLKIYMKHKYNIDIFRCPDEAYIIEYTTGKKIIKILEKKEQNVEGSVETKLWAGPSLKREYELILGNNFEVHYGFCLSNFLKNKMISTEEKYVILNIIFCENNISVLFGDDDDYFEKLDEWINNSL